MYQVDTGIIQRTNIQTDVIVVNQCDKDDINEFTFINKKGEQCRAKFINTTERGLSRSRNMAIQNAWGDLCLICDDDELLDDDYADKISEVFEKHTTNPCILFIIERKDLPHGKKHPQKAKVVGFKQILQSSSVQVVFRREHIIKSGVLFDVMLGSGSGNGGGEDNKFLLDIKSRGLSVFYVPVQIGAVLPGESKWFDGFTKQNMLNRGWTSRRSLGFIKGLLFVAQFGVKHYKSYKNEMSLTKAYSYMLKGFFENRYN